MKTVMPKTKKLKDEEAGFVSLVVALTLIIILALLTVGFAQLARREQKQALDKQLSVQAKYAAESGINDATEAIIDHPITYQTVGADGKTCMNRQSPAITPLASDINIDTAVKYTCVLINARPDTLKYDGVEAEKSRTTSFRAIDPTTNPVSFVKIQQLIIQWDSPSKHDNDNLDNHVNYPSSYASTGFMPSDQWNAPSRKYQGVIEFSITPYDASSTNQVALIGSQQTFYLYPNLGPGGSIAYSGASGHGRIVEGNCSVSTDVCQATVTFAPTATAAVNSKYVIHFLSRYTTSNLTISAKDFAGKRIAFVDGQIMVDVTGKAQDVLKRLQVRVNAKPDLPDFPIESQNVCKRLATEPGGTDFIASNGVPANSTNDPFCIPD